MAVQALGALLLLLCSVSGLNGVSVRASASQAPSLAASADPFCCRSDVKWKDAGDSKDIQGTTMCRNARTSELLPVHLTLALLRSHSCASMIVCFRHAPSNLALLICEERLHQLFPSSRLDNDTETVMAGRVYEASKTAVVDVGGCDAGVY